MEYVKAAKNQLARQLADISAALHNASTDIEMYQRAVESMPDAIDPARYGDPGRPSAAWFVRNAVHDVHDLLMKLRLDDLAVQAAQVDVLMTQAWHGVDR